MLPFFAWKIFSISFFISLDFYLQVLLVSLQYTKGATLKIIPPDIKLVKNKILKCQKNLYILCFLSYVSKNARLITLYFFLFFFFNIANAAAAPPRTTTVIAEMLIIAVLPLNHPPFFIFSDTI